MSMFSTNGVKTGEKVAKFFNFGINKAMIKDIIVKTSQAGSKSTIFMMESDPMGPDFEGFEGAKGKVCRMKTAWMKDDKAYKDFMRQIGVIADKMNVRREVDSIEASTIEDYIAKLIPIVRNRPAWWIFAAEYYSENKFNIQMPKYAFVKSIEEVDESTIVYENVGGTQVITSIAGKNGKVGLTFDPTNKYHYSPYAVQDESAPTSAAGWLPQANAATSTPSSPTSFNPFDSNSSIDDLPFGEQ